MADKKKAKVRNAEKEKEEMKKAMEKQAQTQKKRFDIAQKYAKELTKDFKRSLKSVVVYGSTAKGSHKEKSDIDVFVIIDDTRIDREIPDEVKERIWFDLRKTAANVDKDITIQAFMFLTEFFEAIRQVEPLIMEILRSGVPVFDVGVFMPAKRMLQRGYLPTTPEAVGKRIFIAPQHLQVAEYKVKSAAHYMEQAMASAGQAPLMAIGRIPPAKEMVPHELEEYFVKKGLLEQKYVDIAQKIHDFEKNIEHSGKEDKIENLGAKIDELLKETNEFIERMKELVKKLDQDKKSSIVLDTYKIFLKANVGALKIKGIAPPEHLKDLPVAMAEHFPNLKDHHEELFGRLAKAMIVAKKGKAEIIPEGEIAYLRQSTKQFIYELGRALQAGRPGEKALAPAPKVEAKAEEPKPKVDAGNVLKELKETNKDEIVEKSEKIKGRAEVEIKKEMEKRKAELKKLEKEEKRKKKK